MLGPILDFVEEQEVMIVTIPPVSILKNRKIGVRPTLDEWKKTFERNLAGYATTNGRSTGIRAEEPNGQAGVHTCRLAAYVQKKKSHVQVCEEEVADTIRRLVSARGGTEWEYDIRAGTVRVT